MQWNFGINIWTYRIWEILEILKCYNSRFLIYQCAFSKKKIFITFFFSANKKKESTPKKSEKIERVNNAKLPKDFDRLWVMNSIFDKTIDKTRKKKSNQAQNHYWKVPGRGEKLVKLPRTPGTSWRILWILSKSGITKDTDEREGGTNFEPNHE
jgi:hypothetical protein